MKSLADLRGLNKTGVIEMTMTWRAAAAAMAVGATLAGVELAQSQQLGTGENALGRGGAALGGGSAPTDIEDQAAVAPALAGNCVTNRTAFRTQLNFVSTTSTSFVLMPNTHFPVTTGGGCLIVDFSGQVTSDDTAHMMSIRAWIPGIGAAEPSSAFVGRPVAAGVAEARSMRFVFPNVPAGTHTVRMEFRSSNETNTVLASNRTLTVQYRP